MKQGSPNAADGRAVDAALLRLSEQECERYLLIDDGNDDAREIRIILREHLPPG